MESDILLARINDAVNAVFKTDKPKYLGFLSREEKAYVEKYLEKRNIKYCFFGGAEDCERVFWGCSPEWMDTPVFPISAVTFNFRTADTLRHRDFLGALMSLGLKREAIGDILIEQGRAVVFLNEDIAKYVCDNLKKVGNVGVTSNLGVDSYIPERQEIAERSLTVASLRLDCVVSALSDCSRNTACELIESGLVNINSVVCEKTTKIISDGDVLSVRHKGKFEIISSNKLTKKNRTVLVYKAY